MCYDPRCDVLPPSLLRSQRYIRTPSLILLSPPVVSVALPRLCMQPSLLVPTSRASRRHSYTNPLQHKTSVTVTLSIRCYVTSTETFSRSHSIGICYVLSLQVIRFPCDVNRHHCHAPSTTCASRHYHVSLIALHHGCRIHSSLQIFFDWNAILR